MAAFGSAYTIRGQTSVHLHRSDNLQAGGAYVPLNPRYPYERLRFIVGDTQPRVIVAQLQMVPMLAGLGIPIVCVDEAKDELPKESIAKFFDVKLYEEYADREEEILTGTVQSISAQSVTVGLGLSTVAGAEEGGWIFRFPLPRRERGRR